jgi:hypothetical protein
MGNCPGFLRRGGASLCPGRPETKQGVIGMSKTVPIIALVLGVIAIALGLWNLSRADAIAEAAVQQRERALIERLRPTLMSIYDDFEMEVPASARDPETIEDLLLPLIALPASVERTDPAAE